MRTSLALAALLGLALAAPAPAASIAHVIHERRDLQAPGASKWIRRSHVPVGRSLPVRIGLSQQNLDIGHDLAMEVLVPKVFTASS
jgi:tripeptidyl-peptidase-1